MQSRPLKMNFEERGVWNTMKRALKEHNSRNVRQKFYPLNMDSWEKEHKEIEQRYREVIYEMVSARMKFEKEEKQRENELEAANALLLIKIREDRKNARTENKETRKKTRSENKENRKNTSPLRRSSRISNQ